MKEQMVFCNLFRAKSKREKADEKKKPADNRKLQGDQKHSTGTEQKNIDVGHQYVQLQI
jgi:hypothetical protein